MRHPALRRAALYACFTLSGAAGLIYQTSWTRQFAVVFGTSEIAVATVLAAYMAGLALGARLVEGILHKIARPVRCYALLELGIAAATLAIVPLLLKLSDFGLVAWFGHQAAAPESRVSAGMLYELGMALVTLLPPTILMGATLPVLVRDAVHTEHDIGARIGRLYAWNTGGAMLGALLAAFMFLPAWGVRATLWTGAGFNALVAVTAWLWIPESPQPLRDSGDAQTEPRPRLEAGFWILPLMGLSGAAAFTYEVLWTRLLQRLVGGSVQAFGVMVASFLLGIALGGALGSRLARSQIRAARWWAAAQLVSTVAALACWQMLGAWAHSDAPFWQRVVLSGAALLPLTVAIGLTYPLAVRILASDANSASVSSARVYAWNTSGAILGALVGGFLLLPTLRYEGTLNLLAVLGAALASAALCLLWRPHWRWWAGSLLLTALCVIFLRVPQPDSLLHLSPVRHVSGPLLYYGVGRSADVAAVAEPREIGLLSNGLPEAAIAYMGEPTPITIESWMSALAVLARPEARSLLVVGLGGGNAVAAVPPSIAQIDVIELEPEVLRANQAVAALRSRDPLADTRVQVILNDARGALALTDQRYDAIISQPSHPWTAGASHLYTREFFEQVHAHLNADGVFAQWMGAEFVDAPLLRSLLATLHGVFPEVRLYRTAPTALLLLASDGPLDLERHPQRLRAALDSAPRHYAQLGLLAPENLVAALALDTQGVAQLAMSASPITDDDNRLATAGIQDRHLGLNGSDVSRLLADYDPLTHADSFVHRELGDSLAFNFIWNELARTERSDPEARARLQRLTQALGDSEQGAYLRYASDQHDGQVASADLELEGALRRWPDSALLNYARVESHLDDYLAGRAPPEVQSAAARLQGDAASVLQAARAAAVQNWPAVSQLDSSLAAVNPTAPWAAQAVQLRVEWRVRVANPDLRRRYGDEGLQIIDAHAAQEAPLTWYALRALSAVGTDRPQTELESIGSFAALATDTYSRLSTADHALVRERLPGFEGQLQRLAQDPRNAPNRVAFVQQRLAALRNLMH